MLKPFLVSATSVVLASVILLTSPATEAQGPGAKAEQVWGTDIVGSKGDSLAQRGKPAPTPDLSVTATIADYIDVTDNTTGELQRLWMQVRSDGRGRYTDIGLRSFIQGSSGNWYLDMDTSTRQVFLDFSKPIAGTGLNGGAPSAPFNSALVKAGLVTKCDLYNNSWFTIPVGGTVNCPLSIFFETNGANYLLQMNPVIGAYVFPETDFVDVTCRAGLNSQCNSWTVSPHGSKGGCLTSDCSLRQNVARLSRLTTVKGRTVATNQGDFLVSFEISVTNP